MFLDVNQNAKIFLFIRIDEIKYYVLFKFAIFFHEFVFILYFSQEFKYYARAQEYPPK